MVWRWKNPQGELSEKAFSTEHAARAQAMRHAAELSPLELLTWPREKRRRLWLALENSGWVVVYKALEDHGRGAAT